MKREYDHLTLEKKWQSVWSKKKAYQTLNKSKKKKHYVLDMFPYPSGTGLHVGHPKGYIGSDVYARTKRMQGFNVLHPMGYDAFGLPAEQYALEHHIHPRKAVLENVKTFESQLNKIGLSYDWERKVNTTDPNFYKWTQWIFLKIYGSWYNKETDKAEPISELVKKFEKSGNIGINAVTNNNLEFTSAEWKLKTPKEKQDMLMQYRLAYEGYSEVNWCPVLGTVLANDEVVDSPKGPISERGGFPVIKKEMRQWFLRITAYADRLLTGLEGLHWSEHIKEIQRNWIGKSLGAEIPFRIVFKYGQKEGEIKVFTTRPDTLFGATYIVLSPEHPWVTLAIDDDHKGVLDNRLEVREYVEKVKIKSLIERTDALKEKTGIELQGAKAVNPANGEKIPVFVADYVLADYGTGAIMAVPAHDKRDFEFAKKFSLPIKPVVSPNKTNQEFRVQLDDEDNSELASNLRQLGVPKEHTTPSIQLYIFKIEDLKKIISILEKYNVGNEESYEKILNSHDFNLDKKANLEFLDEEVYIGDGILVNSGQFTGMDSNKSKIDIIKSVKGKVVVHYRMRDAVFARQRYWGEPIPLIHDKDGLIREVPGSKLPLKLPEVKFYEPTGTGESPLAGVKIWVKKGLETNTMPGWAGSSWYFLRYMDPKNKKAFAEKKAIGYWKNVDMYIGGAEHATGHVLYARFWHKFLKDYGLTVTEEPFQAWKNQGMILGPDGRKMSKRWGNVINPDDIVKDYGADTLRVYEMFMGPFEGSLPWNSDSIIGSRRFLERVWRLSEKVSKKAKSSKKFESLLHKTVKKVGEDIESFAFNTSVSAMMILVNDLEKEEGVNKKDFEMFLKILSPFAPHITEEIWSLLGNKTLLVLEKWPKGDPKKMFESEVKIAVQINSKVRAETLIPFDSKEEEAVLIVKELPDVQKWLLNKEIKKVIFIPNRLINFVV